MTRKIKKTVTTLSIVFLNVLMSLAGTGPQEENRAFKGSAKGTKYGKGENVVKGDKEKKNKKDKKDKKSKKEDKTE